MLDGVGYLLEAVHVAVFLAHGVRYDEEGGALEEHALPLCASVVKNYLNSSIEKSSFVKRSVIVSSVSSPIFDMRNALPLSLP